MSVHTHSLKAALLVVTLAIAQSASAQALADDSEALVLTALLLRDRCRLGFPALAGDIDSAFAVFRRTNGGVFDAIQGAQGFDERLRDYRNRYRDLVVTEADCRSLPDVFRSPENRIHR